MGEIEKDSLSQLVSEFILSADDPNFNVETQENLARPTSFPSAFVEPYDLMQDTPTPKEEGKGVNPSAPDEDELNSDQLESCLADIYDNKKICRKSFNDYNDSCYPDQKIQLFEEMSSLKKIDPYLKILEEPGDTRFRFKTEGRGTLHGLNSSKEVKTSPTIQIVGYQGPAKVLISCVECSTPYKAHPHQLIGKGECKDGVCIVSVHNIEQPIIFQNLGIARVTVKDIRGSLMTREKQQIDPFNQGFDLKTTTRNVNLHQIRLCFQAYLGSNETGFRALRPVLSRIIRNKEPNSELHISNYSDNTSPVKGGKKILMFCGRIDRDDIEVRFEFFINGNDKVTLKGTFEPKDVHKHCGIAFRTPPYVDQKITEPVKVDMILYKPSDRTSSDPIEFWFMPEPPNNFQIANPTFKHPQQGLSQSQNSKLKRSKQRMCDGEESTGRICIPASRVKGEAEKNISHTDKERRDQAGSFTELTATKTESKGLFVEEIERYANSVGAENNRSIINPIVSHTLNDNARIEDVLGDCNTAEILDIAVSINPEDIESLSEQLSGGMNFKK